MAGDYFYEGADYGFDPGYGGTSQAYSSRISSEVGLATDARTANVLKEISGKLSSGATTIEVTQVFPEVFESIPKEHFKELDRLRKLVGDNVELTLHAPIVEPTGLSKKGWDEHEREQAERQMFAAIEKAHELNPKGNVVTTFHASAIGLPAETKVWEEVKEGGETKIVPVLREAIVIDERTGGIETIPAKVSAFESEQKFDLKKRIDKLNRDNWYKTLQHVNYGVENGANIIEHGLKEGMEYIEKEGEQEVLKIYKDYVEGKVDDVEKKLKVLEEREPAAREKTKEILQRLTHGDIYLRDAYAGLRDMFDHAYEALKKSDTPEAKANLEKLDNFRKEIQPKLDYLKDPEHIHEFSNLLRKGVDTLRSVESVPILKPFKEFAIEKSAETFSNVAFESFKKFGENSPIVSIENPPAGQGILHTGEDLKELIKESREKFAQKAVKELGFSKSHAKEEAEKLIGATWDVGHINMLRKYGAGEKELGKETEKVAPYIKHMHLSDNFGMEHTELPMGMGNVPMKEMMKYVDKNKKFKKVVEALNWYQHFQTTPLPETLEHFNSPIYAMKNASYWGPQGYFAGFGANPEIHHAMYGAGFANLPIELGGQMAGRSRVSGAPID